MASNNLTYIIQVICLYWAVSISMVYLNKVLLSNEEASIPAPFFLTWFQCLVTIAICIAIGEVGVRFRKGGGGHLPIAESSIFDEFPPIRFKWQNALAVLPLSVVFVGMIALNSLCLKYVEVSFYNVARSLSIVFNVIFTFLVLGKTTSFKTCLALLIVILGFYLGIDGEVNFSVFGTAAGVASSIFVSLNSIMTAKVLPKVNNDKSLLIYYNNFNALLLFLPFIAYYEYEIIMSNVLKFYSVIFWGGMLLSGIMGFAIGLVTVMQVKATSPLTHNISGTAKAAAQSVLALYIWGNAYTAKGMIGMFMVLFGSAVYSYVQMQSFSK